MIPTEIVYHIAYFAVSAKDMARIFLAFSMDPIGINNMVVVKRKYPLITFRLPCGDLHRMDGPAIINGCPGIPPVYGGSINNFEWWLYGKKHRIDGPAIITPSGHKFYYYNGTLTRIVSILFR